MASKQLEIVRRRVAVEPKVDHRIFLIRGQKIMLGTDLAELYRVSAKAFNQAVRRNPERFPKDFMFQSTKIESSGLR